MLPLNWHRILQQCKRFMLSASFLCLSYLSFLYLKDRKTFNLYNSILFWEEFIIYLILYSDYFTFCKILHNHSVTSNALMPNDMYFFFFFSFYMSLSFFFSKRLSPLVSNVQVTIWKCNTIRIGCYTKLIDFARSPTLISIIVNHFNLWNIQ